VILLGFYSSNPISGSREASSWSLLLYIMDNTEVAGIVKYGYLDLRLAG